MKTIKIALLVCALSIMNLSLYAREFKGHLSVDFIDRQKHEFFIRTMATLSQGNNAQFELLSSEREDLSLRNKYFIKFRIDKYTLDSYSAELVVFQRDNGRVVMVTSFEGLLGDQSHLSFEERGYQLTLISNIDKVFTLDEIKERFKQ